jgi:hypothetical protein
MIVFEIVIVAGFMAFVAQAHKLREMKKHDKHLYALCQLRRDVVSYLYVSRQELSRTDYIAARKTLDVLSLTIQNYWTHKTVIFNFRRFQKYMHQTKDLSGQMDEIHTKNADITRFQERFMSLVFEGFLAYTPFLKSELAVKFVIAIFNALAVVGNHAVNSYVESLKDASRLLAQHAQRDHRTC